MEPILFFDTEINMDGKICDIGAYLNDNVKLHSTSMQQLISLVKVSKFIAGHNVFNHDLKYMLQLFSETNLKRTQIIDTLYLSALLFPRNPYHALLKDDKLLTEELNNPLNDAIKSRDLFLDELSAWEKLPHDIKQIFVSLLKEREEFAGFFNYLDMNNQNISIGMKVRKLFINQHSSLLDTLSVNQLVKLIKDVFHDEICNTADLEGLINLSPVSLAYCLSLINVKNRYSITPPWVIKQFPDVNRVMYLLRNNPCVPGCIYCNQQLDPVLGLKRFFGFDSYRTYGGEALQENAVSSALKNESLLAVFPTGGGKSITFQVPALMQGDSVKGLTIIISPLQSLMKDQVDNLENNNITQAVTINGLLDPIERAKSFERVENGTASLLYISPESLRSKSIERLVLNRNVVRFVIDEAHCFSSWGQDFRVDYLYIGEFIRMIMQKKQLSEPIPISCFTATAKQNVIEDICEYFEEKLNQKLKVFISTANRTNLHYRVIHEDSEEDKYLTLRELIIEKHCPTIVYVSRTGKAKDIAERLSSDGINALAYHGKMDKKEKSYNQDQFMLGNVQVIVATSAFGMGVDKKDVRLVIHFQISDSLENYLQEAGRAGRDENIQAECFVLYNEEDLSKHFIMLNQTKLSIQEIQQVWKAIKEITKMRHNISQSALEIARKSGWDDSVMDIETRVKTAIAALEASGYVKRGQNMPRIYANSINVKNAQEAVEKINASNVFTDLQRIQAIRIIKKLISQRSHKPDNEDTAESRVDYIGDHLGIVKEQVIEVIQLLKNIGILSDHKDLSAYLKSNKQNTNSLKILKQYNQIENFLFDYLIEEEQDIDIKDMNEKASLEGLENVSVPTIKTILNIWAIKNWIKRKPNYAYKSRMTIAFSQNKSLVKEKLEKRHDLSRWLLQYLFEKGSVKEESNENRDLMIDFSLLELKESYEKEISFISKNVTTEEIEDALFYLSRIEALKIEGGFMVIYNSLTLERLEHDNKRRYKIEDYTKLSNYYQSKAQQIHIVGEYASKMLKDYSKALQFVDDYFRMNYAIFLLKYFKGERAGEIKKNITPQKFRQLFGTLSPSQLSIINDQTSQYIVVAAGPGSGKTRILVHKLASLLLMEDVKHEQLLMLTFSRAAATEFKKRLLSLIGNAANFVEIKTFHSFCFDLLGRVGTLEKSEAIIQQAIKMIRDQEVEPGRIAKTVLVIDEAQDMDANEFELVKTLISLNDMMRIVAVGDDDQNIYEFRGANSYHMASLMHDYEAKLYELVENYRSKSNLIELTNNFVEKIPNRLKSKPIVSKNLELGHISVYQYKNRHILEPMLKSIIDLGLSGSTCIMTNTNEEALQVAGRLKQLGIPTKLIQSNEGFHIKQLVEIDYFIQSLNLNADDYIIDDGLFDEAKDKLVKKYRNSQNLEIAWRLIREFENQTPRYKYKSDFFSYIQESKLDDFYSESHETIFVSTIHKSKGREFDNVFIAFNSQKKLSPDVLRQLYVGMTRAKNLLHIHHSNNELNSLKATGLEIIKDYKDYATSNILVLQLGYGDVWLDNFLNVQKILRNYHSGQYIKVELGGCKDDYGRWIIKFSKSFKTKLEKYILKGYQLSEAKIRFMVWWKKEGEDEKIIIALPEVSMKKNNKV